MRHLAASVLSIAVLATTAAAQVPPPAAPADSTTGEAVFAVSGRGWGHGVGLAQWGAFGQAKEGRTYDQILAHYYTGTELGRAGKTDVRVLLAQIAWVSLLMGLGVGLLRARARPETVLMALTVLGINMLGDGLRESLDPRMKR